MNDFLTLLLVFVELNVQNLPVTYTDTGMAALMALVAIVTTKVLHLTLMVDSDFINITPYLESCALVVCALAMNDFLK